MSSNASIISRLIQPGGNLITGDDHRSALGAGGFALGSDSLNGYIDDFRITKGVGRYTANFTPPAAKLQNL